MGIYPTVNFPPNSCSLEIPSNFIGKFYTTTSIRNSMFTTTYSQLEIFHGHHICDHHSLKFPCPQISHVRHPDICRTHTTPFLYDSHRRQKLLKTFFLPVVILNRHETSCCLICHMSHDELAIHTDRHPNNVLTTVALGKLTCFLAMPCYLS